MQKGSYQVLRREICRTLPTLNEIALRAWAPAAATLLMRGVAGMQPLTKQGELFKPAFATQLVDTVTCFDGWLASRLARPDASLAVHLEFSGACAAVTGARQGAYAPRLDDVAALASSEYPCIDCQH